MRSALCLLALAVFLVGVPAGNIATGGAPDHLLPHDLPDLTDSEAVWQALRWSFLDGYLVPWLCHAAVWLGWLIGAVLVLADAVRLLRAGGAALHHHLAARSPRAWITSAVASALILFSASNAIAHTTGTAIVATADQHPQPPARLVDAYSVPADVRPDCPRHQVVLGDTYWSLAERHLGDGRSYQEIDALNRDRIPDPRQLLPGMTVLLPPDATNLPQPAPEGAREVVVTPGETASSIALREYGNANAWHRLWDLNRDRPQPDGRAWRNPNLLLPGWHLLVAEPESPPSAPKPSPPVPEPPAPPSPATVPTSTPQPTPSTSAVPTTTVSRPSGTSAGIDIAGDVYLSLGIAAAVTTAMLTIRALHRRHYRVGSKRRADLQQPVAPVVRALRIAHDRATTEHALSPAPQRIQPGQDNALTIAATTGLGLSGPGAEAAARALLVHFLSEPTTHVVTTGADLARLLGGAAEDLKHPRLTVTASIDSALVGIETDQPGTTTALITTPQPHTDQQLKHLLASAGVLAVLLDQWSLGSSVEVDLDGTVTATDATGLRNTRLFVLPAAEAADVLRLFATAAEQPTPATDEQPATQPATNGATQAKVFELCVFGAVRLTYNGPGGRADLSGEITPRHRELLAFLACHPDGVRREALNDAIWPDANPDRPYNNLHYTLSTLRKAIAKATEGHSTNFVVNVGGRYRLDPDVIGTDYVRLYAAIARTPQAGPLDVPLFLDLYRGDLAEDISTLWLDAFREAARRDMLDALDSLARATDEPATRLRILERIRGIDPYAEEVYREIMRTQSQLGQRDAISRTIELLTTKLGEIDEEPGRETIALARTLQNAVPFTPASA